MTRQNTVFFVKKMRAMSQKNGCKCNESRLHTLSHSVIFEFTSRYAERFKEYDSTSISYIFNLSPLHCSLSYNSIFAPVCHCGTHTSYFASNIFSIQSGKNFITEVSLSPAKSITQVRGGGVSPPSVHPSKKIITTNAKMRFASIHK